MRRVIFTDPETNVPEIVAVLTWDELLAEVDEHGDQEPQP